MSDMVEQVAQAILKAGFQVPAHDIALIAIKTMREPTVAMIKAHHVVPDDTNFEDRARDNWQAMIDAALVTEPAE